MGWCQCIVRRQVGDKLPEPAWLHACCHFVRGELNPQLEHLLPLVLEQVLIGRIKLGSTEGFTWKGFAMSKPSLTRLNSVLPASGEIQERAKIVPDGSRKTRRVRTHV